MKKLNDAAAELRRAFQEGGLTMAALTKAVQQDVGGTRGSSESSLRNYLRGRVTNPRSEILVAMARVLGVNEQFILQGTGDPTPAETVVRESAGEPVGCADEDRGWRDEAVAEIRKSSVVANSPTTVVRTGFFDLVMQVTASPACGLDKNVEATAEMANLLDDLIWQPIRMFYPKAAPPMSAASVRSYLTGVLHSLTLLVPQDDSGGRFGLPGKPVIDAESVVSVVLSAADEWSMRVPIGEKEEMVPLGDLDKDGVRILAQQCRDLSKALVSASWRLETAAEGMNVSERARESKSLVKELPLLSRIAPALCAGAEEEAHAANVRSEKRRVWTALRKMAGDLSVEEYLTKVMTDVRARRDRSKEKEHDDE